MIRLISFGYKYGAPPEEASIVIDCRALLNPHYERTLKHLDGRDQKVQDYVLGNELATPVVLRAIEALNVNTTLAFGCVGGRHRSVALAEHIAAQLREVGRQVIVEHRALKA